MIREIKFRGKSLALDVKGEHFVYGSLVIQDGIPFIYEDKKDKGSINYHQVTPSTIGQFTGLLDKNGKEIYEGDKVRYIESYGCNDEEPETITSVVIFYPTHIFPFSNVRDVDDCWYSVEHSEYEVVGNIHD